VSGLLVSNLLILDLTKACPGRADVCSVPKYPFVGRRVFGLGDTRLAYKPSAFGCESREFSVFTALYKNLQNTDCEKT